MADKINYNNGHLPGQIVCLSDNNMVLIDYLCVWFNIEWKMSKKIMGTYILEYTVGELLSIAMMLVNQI